MMIGSSRVRASPRNVRAKASPDWPGSIQSSNIRSGSALLICACAVSASAHAWTEKPASSRLTRSNSWIAGSSSTTRIDALIVRPASASVGDLGPDLFGSRVAHVLALDDVNDVLRDVLRVIADTLDRLGDEHDLERGGYRARVLHHVADQLPEDREKREIDRLVVADNLRCGRDIQTCKCVQGELEIVLGQFRRASDFVEANIRQPLGALHLLCLVGDLLDLVRGALELVDDLDHRQHHPQVDG